MKCHDCKRNTLRIDIELTGGCSGNCGDYCYCDSPDAEIVLYCSSNKCRYSHTPRSYADKYSIARLITDLITEKKLKELVKDEGKTHGRWWR